MTTSIFIPGATFEVTATLDLASTTGSNIGVITKNNGTSFIHDYNNGANLFFGRSAGNFTLTGTSNIGIGTSTLVGATSALRNIIIGMNAGDAITIGNDNISLGDNVLNALISGNNNIGIGTSALINTATGVSSNIAIGRNSLADITTNGNTVIGDLAAQNATNASNIVAIGSSAMGTGIVTGANNIAIGVSSSIVLTGGANNITIGTNSGLTLGSGNRNILFGVNAGAALTTQSDSIAIGDNAMNSATSNCIAIGSNTLAINSGGNNIAIGINNLSASSTASQCIAIGFNVMSQFNITGINNTAIGYNSMTAATGAAANNTMLGALTGTALSSGTNNIFIGLNAGNTITTTGGNICIDNVGVVGDTNIIRIGTNQVKTFIQGIRGVSTDAGDGIPLYISSTGQLGTAGTSSSAVTAMSTFGSTPNADGGTISGSSLQLQPADGSNPGGVSTGAQTFAGAKTFTNGIALSAFTSILTTYSKATVSITWSGACPSTAMNVIFERIGSIVHMYIQELFTAKANAGAGATFDGNGTVPAEFLPTTQTYASCMIWSSTAPFASGLDDFYFGIMLIGTTGVFHIGPAKEPGGGLTPLFTNGGSGTNNGFAEQVITYIIN